MNKAIYDGYVVKLPNSHGEMEEIGGLHAFGTVDRLVTAAAFVYTTEIGSVGVRLESKARGPLMGYWSAYKRIGGRLRKTYVAAAFALDPYNLEEAAQRLLASLGAEPNPRQGDLHE